MELHDMTNDYSPKPIKHPEMVKNTTRMMKRKNFLNGIHNALNILNGLERCLKKTGEYEKRMLKCKSSHSHTHNNDWWESEPSEGKEKKAPDTGKTKSSRSQVDLAESWSTMSIVCLQYQYEELSKRYEALLREYDARCGALNERDRTVARLQEDASSAHAQLVRAHRALLSVGERYLVLRRKRLMQKQWYEERIEALKRVVQEITNEVEQTGLVLNEQLHEIAVPQQEADTDLLVTEIRRCNSLFLENLHLKAEMEGISGVSGTFKTY